MESVEYIKRKSAPWAYDCGREPFRPEKLNTITRPAGQMVALAVPNIYQVETRYIENHEVELYGAWTETFFSVMPKLKH